MPEKKHDGRTGYAMVPNELIASYGKVIGPYGIAVYVALVRYARTGHEDPARGLCWPSVSQIAEEVGACRAKVLETLSDLEAVGLVEMKRHPQLGGNRHLFCVKLYGEVEPYVGPSRPKRTGRPGRPKRPRHRAEVEDM